MRSTGVAKGAAPTQGQLARASSRAAALLISVGVFWVAYDGGAYGLTARSALAVVIWWSILLGVAVGLWPRARLGRAELLTAGLLVGFAVLTGASVFWGASAERAFLELSRSVLYVGVVALATLAVREATAARWSDGIAAGLAATAVLALLSRFFSGLADEGELPRLLPDAYTRLSYPVNYWNGLAILVALACPLLLRVAVAAPAPGMRALAVAPLPVISCVVYLASSRSGAVTAIIGVAVFVVLVDCRWRAVSAVASGGIGACVALAYVVRQHELVNGPLDSTAAASQGRAAAAVVLAACVLGAAVYALGDRLLTYRLAPSRWVGWIAVAISVLFLAVFVVTADPGRRWSEFTRPPPKMEATSYIEKHFLSGNGNWRWQYWRAAVDQCRERPLVGGGAATYEAWWAQHGITVGFVQNPHSLYAQTLGELGVLGLGLIAGALATGIWTGARRALRAPPPARAAAAAVASAFTAYAAALGLDWMWQLTAVSVVGMLLLGLCVGPAMRASRLAPAPSPPLVGRRVKLARAAAVAFAAVVVAAELNLVAAEVKLRESQSAAQRGDVAGAARSAAAARELQPWAASPYLQLALVAEDAGKLKTARRWLDEALERDTRDWRLWLISARIDTKLGHVPGARAGLARAAELNPRSPLFAGIPQEAAGTG